MDFARKWDDWRWARRWPRIMVVSRSGTPAGAHTVTCDCAEAAPSVPQHFIEILVPPRERRGFEMLVSKECMALLDDAFEHEFEDCGIRTPLSYSSGPDAFMRSGMPQKQATALARRAVEIVRKDRLSDCDDFLTGAIR